MRLAIDNDDRINLGVVGPILDRLADAIDEVMVIGETVREESQSAERRQTGEVGASMGVSLEGIAAQASGKASAGETEGRQVSVRQSGSQRQRVHFGSLRQALSDLMHAMSKVHIWLLLDEWSVVPTELQPYLADLLRRSFLPVRGITVKIAAIEQRSQFQLANEQGDYIGIELGADASADINLDDFMVFDNDADRAVEFFSQLVHRHVSAALEEMGAKTLPKTPNAFIQAAFTQHPAFEEVVKAAEGVPRDAMYILSIAAQKATRSSVAMDRVREAAKTWYQRDKDRAVASNPRSRDLLRWIVDEVIAHRRTQAFLLRADTRHPLIDSLVDARVLHLRKRNVSAHDQPGIRYDVYKIDYGCYVDLQNTQKATGGLLSSEDENGESKFVDVPPDDYRSIRRAILDLDVFDREKTPPNESHAR